MKNTNHTARGVVVAPPSGNTSTIPNMTILHKGFDTIHLSIKAALTPAFLAYLESEQARAKAENESVLCSYGDVQFHLKHHGGSGYQFLLDGGPDGATWAFKRPHPKDPWGIRIVIGSRFLALYGLGRARAHIEDTLAAWGIRFLPDDVSFARIDFCVDIFAPNFVLQPDQFVMHSSTGRRDHVANADTAIHGKSSRTTSVTIGKMPNRQVIVYDKREEVIARSKTYWWEIWNDTLRRAGLPLLDYDTLRRAGRNGEALRRAGRNGEALRNVSYIDGAVPVIDASAPKQSRVWRVEVRAGKDCLKDTWGIRTWAQVFELFGDLVRHTGAVIRYASPESDPNRSRWPNHPLWEAVTSAMENDLEEMRSGADPNPIKQVHRETHISMIKQQAFGLTTTLAALNGVLYEDFDTFLAGVADQFRVVANDDPDGTAIKLQKAKERYAFFDAPQKVGKGK